MIMSVHGTTTTPVSETLSFQIIYFLMPAVLFNDNWCTQRKTRGKLKRSEDTETSCNENNKKLEAVLPNISRKQAAERAENPFLSVVTLTFDI